MLTTVNVQHIESLYDIVERFTGVKVKERVPDSVILEADQIVNVDVPAEDLMDRLKRGQVYPLERAERAHREDRCRNTAADFRGEYRITQILLGRTKQPWYRRWFGSTPLDRLLRVVRNVNVLVVDVGSCNRVD